MADITSPLKAIKQNCIDCSGGSANEVKLCPCTNCPMYPFRFGKNPYTKRVFTEEQKEASRERLKKVREAKTEKDATND